VNAVADVWITKVDVPAEGRLDKPFEPDEAIAGNEHRYRIDIGNNGPSVALNVNVTDLLDFKQVNILGESFVRCEPIDPDDQVTCTGPLVGPLNTVTVTRLQVGNEAVIPTAGTGTLVPGKGYGFYLITRVDSGYVLDADNGGSQAAGIGQLAKGFLALDTANITTTTTDFRTQNNSDRHQTIIRRGGPVGDEDRHLRDGPGERLPAVRPGGAGRDGDLQHRGDEQRSVGRSAGDPGGSAAGGPGAGPGAGDDHSERGPGAGPERCGSGPGAGRRADRGAGGNDRATREAQPGG
jgi:hypothetical protein